MAPICPLRAASFVACKGKPKRKPTSANASIRTMRSTNTVNWFPKIRAKTSFIMCRARLFTFEGILLKNFRDAFIDRLRNKLRIRLQISAGRSLQHIRYRAPKNDSVCFYIKEIDHQRPSRNVPHRRRCASDQSAVSGIDDVVERKTRDLEVGTRSR